MSDHKRQSFASKVATPRPSGGALAASPAASSSVDVESLVGAIGARIKLTTSGTPQSQSYEGALYTVCTVTQLAAINTRSAPAVPSSASANHSGDYHIIPLARIQSFQILSPAENAGALVPAPVDLKRVAKREADRIRALKDEEQNRGKGVTAEAQAIFDSFKRINTPIRWHNQEMIVHDAVIISPPYTVDDCRGAKDKQETLNRVKKVLEGERRKLKEREERERRASAVGGPRKGG